MSNTTKTSSPQLPRPTPQQAERFNSFMERNSDGFWRLAREGAEMAVSDLEPESAEDWQDIASQKK